MSGTIRGVLGQGRSWGSPWRTMKKEGLDDMRLIRCDVKLEVFAGDAESASEANEGWFMVGSELWAVFGGGARKCQLRGEWREG